MMNQIKGINMLTNDQIKEIALQNGFKLKEQPGGEMDLNPYVYHFARALVEHAGNSAVLQGDFKMIKERKMASYLKNGIWIECDDYVDNSWNDDEGLEDVVFRIGYSKEISMFDTYDSKLDIYQIELISDMPKFYVAFCPFYSAVQNIYIHSTHDLICFFKEIKPMMDLILKDEEIKNKEMEA